MKPSVISISGNWIGQTSILSGFSGGVGITAGTSWQNAGGLPGITHRPVSRPSARHRGGSAGPLLPKVPDLLERIDLVMETPDALHIVNFKTSRGRRSADQVAEPSGQLLLYSQLADCAPRGPGGRGRLCRSSSWRRRRERADPARCECLFRNAIDEWRTMGRTHPQGVASDSDAGILVCYLFRLRPPFSQ